jgi:hypothetical protein
VENIASVLLDNLHVQASAELFDISMRDTPLVMTPAVFERMTVSPLIEPLSSRK